MNAPFPSYFNEALSVREIEVLNLIVDEFSSKEIAKRLHISLHTVITHRKNLLSKLNAKNTAGLVRRAFEEHYFKVSEKAMS